MARKVTVTFDNGATHTYEGVPDSATPESVQERALRDFGARTIIDIDGGRENGASYTLGQPGGDTDAGDVVQAGVSAIAPAGMYGPTGAVELAKDIKGAQVMAPLVDAAKSRAGSYLAKPGKAIVDAATMITTGVPGAAPAALYDTYKAVQEAAPRMSQALGSIGNINEQAFTGLYNKLRPDDAKALGDLVAKSGGKAALTNFQLPKYLAQDAEAVAALAAIKSQATAAPGVASRLLGPVAKGIAKVAGPVGIGLNLYDAGQMARETQLGQSLAAGQGQRAEQAFRAGPVQSYQGPQLDTQQAQNVLHSGSPRDIQYFGGKDRLNEMIRKKAAEKVLGPIAPGTF